MKTFTNRFFTAVMLLVTAFVLIGAAAVDPNDPSALLKVLYSFILDKNYSAAIGIGVLLATYAIREYDIYIPVVGPKIDAFNKSDPGGVLLAFLTSFGLNLAATSSVVLSAAFFLGSAKTAIYGIGVFIILTKFLMPVAKMVFPQFFLTGEQRAAEVEKKGEVAGKEVVAGKSGADALNAVGNTTPPNTIR